MPHWLPPAFWFSHPSRILPALASALVALAAAWALSALLRRLRAHAEALRLLDLRVSHLHADAAAQRRHSLRIPSTVAPATSSPPPLSEAATIEVTEEMLATRLALFIKPDNTGKETAMASKPSELDPAVAADQLALIARLALLGEPLDRDMRQTLWRLMPFLSALRTVASRDPNALRAEWWLQLNAQNDGAPS